jgi:hypothetical protein
LGRKAKTPRESFHWSTLFNYGKSPSGAGFIAKPYA